MTLSYTVYRQRHKMLGRARDYQCELKLDARCKGVARDWALDWRNVHPDNLRVTEAGLRYSVGMDDDYVPACSICHKAFDREQRTKERSAHG